MRISDGHFIQTFLRGFSANRAETDRAIRQLLDGRAVRRASDDPAGAQTSLELRSRLVRVEGYERSAELARFDLVTIEQALGDTFDALADARGKAVAGPSPGTDNETLAGEVDELRLRLLDRANTSQGGRYLFAGTRTLGPPFDGAGGYSGTTAEAQAPLDQRKSVGTTLSGERVFLEGGDVFATLSDLSVALRAEDTAEINAAIGALNTQLDHVNSIRAEVGGRIQRIDVTLEDHAGEGLRLRQRIEEIEGVQLERAALELNAATASYEALAGTASQVLGRSLFDFLR